MNKKYAIKLSGIGFLAAILLTMPQCIPGTDISGGSFYNSLINFFDGKSRYDFNQLKDKKNVYPMVVIGSGPAGLSAGLYGARAKKKTLVIEGMKPGGLLTETSYVENWPGFKAILGKDLMNELKAQAAYFGASFLEDTVERVDFSQWPFVIYTDDGKIIYALTVIIATGASPSPLNIPGEKEFWGKGVTTCAICDAPFYANKNVVIIGGGDSAIAEAIQLSAYADKITILVRKDKMRAAPTNQELLKGYPKVSIMYNIEPKEILGDEKHVTGIKIYNNKTKETSIMPIDGVFLAIGHKPNTGLFKGSVKLDSNGYIIVEGRTQATSIPGVYAAGDVEDHRYRQAGIAAGSGIKAALDADFWLNELGFTEEIAHRLQDNQLAAVTIEPSLVKHIASLEDFERTIAESKLPVIVDFYADYCPSCMQMLPHFKTVAQQFKNLALFASVDIAKLPDLAAKFHVTKIPCILVFKDGALAARYTTAMGKKELQDLAARTVGQSPAE
ncbi:MAG: bifunctional thioredoxin reductase/thioredoxin [Candidatus Babeliales bacterium]